MLVIIIISFLASHHVLICLPHFQPRVLTPGSINPLDLSGDADVEMLIVLNVQNVMFARGIVASMQCFLDLTLEEKAFYGLPADRVLLLANPYFHDKLGGSCGNLDGVKGNE